MRTLLLFSLLLISSLQGASCPPLRLGTLPPGRWQVSGGAVYSRMSTPPFLLATIPPPTGETTPLQDLFLDNKWSWSPMGKILYLGSSRCWFALLDYLYFNASIRNNYLSAVDFHFSGGTHNGNFLVSKRADEWNGGHLVIGSIFCLTEGMELRLFGGLEQMRWVEKRELLLFSFFPPSPLEELESLVGSSRYEGWGPGAGIEGRWSVLGPLSIVGTVQSFLLIGRARQNLLRVTSEGTNIATIAYPRRTLFVPTVEFALAAKACFRFGGVSFASEWGIEGKFFSGGFYIHQTTNFEHVARQSMGLYGPYATLSIEF